ncbi:MAG: glycosyltransferase family 4 protein [Bryobacterales bacterium]|nr:glycosyltransferase family 4 protein [Bryobacterales bacterium]
MAPRILLLLPQLPQDPSSGAARTAQTAAEMALQSGFDVRALATTATERALHADPVAHLRALNLEPEIRPASSHSARELRFQQRGIPYTLLDTGRFSIAQWEKTHGRQFDRLFDETLLSFNPDIVFTYGGLPGDIRRLRRARQRHIRIAFCVFNMSYLDAAFFRNIDIVTTPSEFLRRRYLHLIGVDSTVLPTPIEFDDVLAPNHDPIFVTIVNPSVEKGLFFFARLAEELGRTQPKIAVLAIESRGTAGNVVQAALGGGFDLRRHESIMISPPVPTPRDIFANTRILLVPSVWEEPSGRVAAEALVNSVPPIVSNRGGLEESCNGAGFVLPLPDDLTIHTRKPVSPQAVQPWLDAIVQLCFDENEYQRQAAKARQASSLYLRENLTPRYAAFFHHALSLPGKP